MFEGVQKFIALGVARWAAGIVAGSVIGFIAAHAQIGAWITEACSTVNDPEKLSAGIVAAAVAGTTLFFSVKDKLNVGDKVTTAAIMGTTQAADNPAVRADVVAAVKAGQIPAPTHDAPNLDDVIAARQAAARGGE